MCVCVCMCVCWGGGGFRLAYTLESGYPAKGTTLCGSAFESRDKPCPLRWPRRALRALAPVRCVRGFFCFDRLLVRAAMALGAALVPADTASAPTTPTTGRANGRSGGEGNGKARDAHATTGVFGHVLREEVVDVGVIVDPAAPLSSPLVRSIPGMDTGTNLPAGKGGGGDEDLLAFRTRSMVTAAAGISRRPASPPNGPRGPLPSRCHRVATDGIGDRAGGRRPGGRPGLWGVCAAPLPDRCRVPVRRPTPARSQPAPFRIAA